MSEQGGSGLRRTGIRAGLFVLGFSVVFTAMGATASSIGQMLSAKTVFFTHIGGVVVIIFGLHMLGVFRINALYGEKRIHLKFSNVGDYSAFLIGVTFAFGWTPCIGPILAAILSLAADSKTVGHGTMLLAIYSLGLGVPFLIAGLATGRVLKLLIRFKRHFRKIEFASGVCVVFVGILVFTGKFEMITSILNSWSMRGR